MKLPAQYKYKAVLAVLEEGKPVSKVAGDFKIARKTLYDWIKRYQKAPHNKKSNVLLTDNHKKGKDHHRSYRWRFKDSLISEVVKNPKLSATELAKKLDIGRHAVVSLLIELDLSKRSDREAFARIYIAPRRLHADIKLAAVRAVLDGRSVSNVARENGVARKTVYEWLKRYKKEWKVKEKYVSGYDHPKALSASQVKSILDKVVEIPEASIHNLAKTLPFSSHGIFNVLKRYGLTVKEARFAYSKARREVLAQKPVPVSFLDRIRLVWEQFIPSLAPVPPPTAAAILKALGVSFGLSFVFSFTFLYWVQIISQAPTSDAAIGLAFATVALFMGSIFFLYSLKYYITLAVVLSFSQQEAAGKINGNGNGRKIGFLSGILGWANGRRPGELSGPEGNGRNGRNGSVGLEPNLERISLKKHPAISVHIPLYNEKNVVERAIAASTSFDYKGDYEIILCDDSTDETTRIIRDYMKSVNGKRTTVNGEGWTLTKAELRPGVILKHLHRTSRSGYKGGALKSALEHTDKRAEFVVVLDSDFVPYPDTLELFLKYFKVQNNMSEDYKRSNVAAVQGYQWHVLNKSENWITRGIRSEYAGSYVIERSGREIYQGLKQVSGAVYMIRKDVLEEIGWETSITEDFQLTLKLYEKGYKVVYTPYIQAPAECVSTLKRLIRQRMRWAEGHSNNIRKMFVRLIYGQWSMVNGQKEFTPSPLTLSEKLEFLYLSPYYLQAFFFLVGTISWLISETLFPARLPFWTSLWGWSLVLTNFISLPLMNSVGLFLEESEEKDYAGLASFVALSYILVPFQAYASLKGFLEQEEGPWFRTPKTGRITDVFTRGRFYRFISGILPGRSQPAVAHSLIRSNSLPIRIHSRYLALASANNQFNSFSIRPKKKSWVGNLGLASVSVLSIGLIVAAPFIPLISASASASPTGFKSLQNAVPSSEYTVPQEEITGPVNMTYEGPDESLEYIFHPEPRVRVKIGQKEIETTVIGSDGLGQASPTKVYKEGITYVYEDIFEGVTLRYIAENGKLQEHFVFSEYKEFNSIEEKIHLNDLVMAKIEGEIQFAPEEGGHPIFRFPKPYLYEEGNPDEKNYGIEYQFEKTQFGYKLKKDLTAGGKAWLADPARQFPVVIDPTLVKSTVTTGIVSAEAEFGSVQRKIAFSATANGGAAWYVVYENGNDVMYRRCLQSSNCDADADWSSETDIDQNTGGGTQDGNPTLYRHSDTRLWVAWIDDAGANPDDTLHYGYLDTTTAQPHSLQGHCETGDQGTLDNTSNIPYIAAVSDDDVVVGYTDDADDDEADIWEVEAGGCSFSSIESGSGLPTGTQSFAVAPVVKGNFVFIIYNDDGGNNDMRVSVRDTTDGSESWVTNDTDIDGSQNYNVLEFSATSDGTDVWLLVLPGATTAPDFFRCGACSTTATAPSFTDESDPFGAPTNAEDVSLTYLSTPNEVKAFILRDATNQQVYANTTDADTISWGTEFSLEYTAGDSSDLSSIYSTDDADDAGTVLRYSTNDLEFSTLPENLIYLLALAPLVVLWSKKLASAKGGGSGKRR